MAGRSRPSNLRYRIQPPNRRFWLLLSFWLVLVLTGSVYACGSVLRRANSLGRRCFSGGAHHTDRGDGERRMKVAMVSFSAEEERRGRRSFEGLMEMVSENKRAYAEEKGYDFVDGRGIIDKSRPASWSKILAVRSLLPNYDWVLWNDADTLVANPNISLERILEVVIGTTDFPSSPNLIVTEDVTGVNAGLSSSAAAHESSDLCFTLLFSLHGPMESFDISCLMAQTP